MLLNELFDDVLVINLDRRPDRLEQFDQQARAIGLVYERFPAISESPFTPPTPEHVGRIGASLSHQAIHQQATRRTLVFEDDASFVKGFEAKLELYLRSLPADCEVLFLNAGLKTYDVVGNWIRLHRFWCLMAYGTTPRASKAFVELASPLNYRPIDDHISDAGWLDRVPGYRPQRNLVPFTKKWGSDATVKGTRWASSIS